MLLNLLGALEEKRFSLPGPKDLEELGLKEELAGRPLENAVTTILEELINA